MSASPPRAYAPAEERANTLTHGLGAVLSLLGLALLVTLAARASDATGVIAFTVYGASLVTLYVASTCYHAATEPRRKHRLRIFDHAAIYLLIAGTYTPITLISLSGPWGWTLFGIVWGLALLGVVATLFFTGRYRALSLGIYIGMGWIVVIATEPLFAALPAAALAWLGLGGFFYTGGTVFYAWKRLPFSHAIWHGFVLAGSACHFACIYAYVLPPTPLTGA